MAGILTRSRSSVWDSGTTYKKYSVVSFSGFNYYISAVDDNLNNPPSLSGSTAQWKKIGDSSLNFNDLWTPSYNSAGNNEPKVTKINLDKTLFSFKKQYDYSNLLTNFEVNFIDRDIAEVKSLAAFLEYMGGVYMFKFYLPEPYNQSFNVVCSEWSVSFTSYNRQTLTAIFNQERNLFKNSSSEKGAGQDVLV